MRKLTKKLKKIDDEAKPSSFYLSMKEWSMYEAELPKDVRAGYSMGGYFKAYNPYEGKFITCLSYRGKPVFIRKD